MAEQPGRRLELSFVVDAPPERVFGKMTDPAALGALRWLVLSTPGLPTPGWLQDAIGRDQRELVERPD